MRPNYQDHKNRMKQLEQQVRDASFEKKKKWNNIVWSDTDTMLHIV